MNTQLGKVVGRPAKHMALMRVQGTVAIFIGLARKYATELQLCGWAAVDTRLLERAVSTFEKARSAQAIAKARSKTATKLVRSALADVVVFRNQLSAALRVASLSAGLAFDAKAFQRQLFRADAVRALDWLTSVQSLLAGHDEALKPYLRKSAVRRVDDLHAALFALVTQREMARKAYVAATVELYARCNEVSSLVDRLAAVAAIAFAVDKPRLAEFRRHTLRPRA